ncbi:MAG: hypothetical protein HN742_42135 [Lentisphaerae bacterium]|jgi:HEAT repeat protein|nr:hypothetical protein [Lentisphaerota bacterium]MBT4817550.1 hypothetical protein [Lentisphaerota bacterium]MBT5605905.1 hypothetical protein [Lentisphaerota bacterium]MBT7057984.1 hypothetical protein [Lentisphaerota bacterium]MBT7848539.1 hypothetical protein [Lentisphaerota bacterium]
MRALLILAVCIFPGSMILAASSAVQRHVLDLRSETPLVRRHAAAALGRIGGRAAGAVLIEALADPDVGVRREAAKALGAVRCPEASGALVALLKDPDPTVRFNTAYALGEIRAGASAPALLDALKDSDYGVRDQAAWALRELRAPSLASLLTKALKGEDADAPHIIWILRHLPRDSSIPAVAGLLDEAQPDLRKLAMSILAEIGTADVVEPTIKALGDPNAEVRLSAIRILKGIREDRVVLALRKRISLEPDGAVRALCEEAVFELSKHQDLVAHWSFDDGSTVVAKDLAGSGNHGEIKGCGSVAGQVGDALRFSAGGFVEFGRPSGLPFSGTDFTVSAWIKAEAQSGVVIARGGAACGFSLYIKDGVAKFGIHRVGDEPAFIASGTEKIGKDWVHLAGMVREKAVEVYVNGKRVGVTKTPGYIPGSCGQGMEIGFDVSNSSCEICDAFEGIIDEVKIFQAALGADDLAVECQAK